MRETIIEQTELLKDLPDSVLIKEMKQPTGNLAPPVFITSELKRRQRFRDEFKRREAQDMPTVAEEVVMAAGVPQQGIMQMSKSMAPKTNMGQNTGMADMMPRQPTMGMSSGGVVKMQPGGMMGATPVVLNGFKYNVFPDGRVVPDMIGQPATPLNPSMTSQRQIIEQAMAAANNQTVIPEEPLGVTTQDMALADVEARIAAYEAANPNESPEKYFSRGGGGTYGVERALVRGDLTDRIGRFSDERQNKLYSSLLPPTEEPLGVTTQEMALDAIDKRQEEGRMSPADANFEKIIASGRLSEFDNAPEAVDYGFSRLMPPAVPVSLDNAPKTVAEDSSPMTYDQFVKKAEAGETITEADLVKSIEANLLNGQQAADVNSMLEGDYVPSTQEQSIANLGDNRTEFDYDKPANPNTLPRKIDNAVQDALAGIIQGRTVGEQEQIDAARELQKIEFAEYLEDKQPTNTEELIEDLDKGNKTATVNQAAEVVKDAIGAETLAVASGAQGPQAASQAQQGFTSDNWFQIAALGAMISSGNPEDLQAAAKTFLALESKKADRKALKEQAEKDRQSREKIAQTTADVQARALGQRIDKATRDELYKQFELLGGEQTYQTLLAQLKKDKELPAELLQTLTTLQNLRKKINLGADVKKLNMTDTA